TSITWFVGSAHLYDHQLVAVNQHLGGSQ
ncbi:hypothetical protein LCGC14_2147190, partial [marine sediment metagenome]